MERARVRRTLLYARELSRRLAGPNGLTRQESTFTRRDLLRAIAEAYPEGIAGDELVRRADEVLKGDGIRVSARTGHEPERYTTLDMLATEARLVELATATPRRVPRAGTAAVDHALARDRRLGADQVEAVRHLTSGRERTRLLEARAGYGKTAALQVVRDAYERAGVPVIGTSWQGQAAQTLESEAGIPSLTTARLLNQVLRDEQPIPDGAVVVVDEAAVMPTRALAALAEEVAYRNGRLILVGDRDQLPPIDAGGAFASLADRLGVAQLEENRRQRDALQRRVAGLLADGRAPEALAVLSEHGRFQSYEDARPARADLIEAWAATSLRSPDRALILAHDRRDVAALNQLARERLDGEGLLGSRRLTAHGLEWASGDRLICRRNDYRPDINVRNGTRTTVIGVDSRRGIVRVRTDDGREVALPPDYLAHVDYGYASTGHSSQGATVDRTYMLATPSRGGREWGYVAGTRHRIDLRVYTVHSDAAEAQRELERTWQRSQAKALAIDRMPARDRDRALGRAAKRDRELDEGSVEREREQSTPRAERKPTSPRRERDDIDRERDGRDRGRDDDDRSR